MSKLDAVRALREARFNQERSRQTTQDSPRAAQRAAARASAPIAPEVAHPGAAATPPSTADELCGHPGKGGRTCQRERGHAAKTHRYTDTSNRA
ncbi:hypothetical protein GCM10022237_48230 [Nocardioides ginsengisoli]|uniref:Uncharacterized protein n=1 Tax=Nocardioides ginsengisoli TaxID=363868 RepID=A0ABW3W1H2_9ACTN